MRTVILSDIHANLEGYGAVLDAVDAMGVDRILSLGDLVGYNADPNACMHLTRERGIPSLMGNHDAAACRLIEPHEFNPMARQAVLWTRDELTAEHAAYLREQPEIMRLGDDACLVHGSLLHRDHYLFSQRDLLENVRRMRRSDPEIRILFFGHTHCQVAFACDRRGTIVDVSSTRISLEEDRYYLINPGSVGQPRDHDPRCAFLLYDDGVRTVEFIRLPYDIQACANRILSKGLPRELADRLVQGW